MTSNFELPYLIIISAKLLTEMIDYYIKVKKPREIHEHRVYDFSYKRVILTCCNVKQNQKF